MHRRRMLEIADGLLLIGFALSVMGVGAVSSALADLSAMAEPPMAMRVASPLASARIATQPVAQSPCPCIMPHHRPGDHRAPGAILPDPLLASPTTDRRMERDGLHRHGDIRAYILDAAVAAHWYTWSAPRRGETRTDFWVNDPASIGSTSPP